MLNRVATKKPFPARSTAGSSFLTASQESVVDEQCGLGRNERAAFVTTV